jgi:hypothetical protein
VLFSLAELPALICPPTAAVALLLTGLPALSHTSHADTVNLVIKGSTTILAIRQNAGIHQLRARRQHGTDYDRGSGICTALSLNNTCTWTTFYLA